MFFKNMPRELKDIFRACTVRRGKSMKQVVIRFMRIYIQKYGRMRPENKQGAANPNHPYRKVGHPMKGKSRKGP